MNPSSVDNNGANDSYDPTLDFRSEKFDALKALKQKNIKLPVENVLPLDNISLFRKYLPKNDENRVVITKKTKSDPKKEDKKTKKIEWISPITEIAEKLQNGPTRMLYDCWKENLRVCVYIRSYNKILSKCEGEIIAFDKHINIILRNVYERFIADPESDISPPNDRYLPQTFIMGDTVVLVTRAKRQEELKQK